jgi:ribonuclease D
VVTAVREEGREPDIRALRGWRRELAGAELLELLAGELSLSVERTGGEMRVAIESRGRGFARP